MRASPLFVLGGAVMALASLSLPGCRSGRPANGPEAGFAGARFPPGLRAHDFALTDQDGRIVSLDASKGHVRVVAFLSTGARAAVLVAEQIRGALDELGSQARNVRVLLVSTDLTAPRARARARAVDFLQATSLRGRARYLIGAPRQLRAVWRAYGIPPAAAGERALLSSTPVLLVDGAGSERVGFPVEQLTPEGLAHDIRALIS